MHRLTQQFISITSSWQNRFRCCLAACAVVSAAHGAEVDLTPISGGDGAYSQVTLAGQTAWQNNVNSAYLYCRRPDSFPRAAGQSLYVRVTYFDDATGIVDLQYDSQTNAYTISPLHTRTSRVGSGQFVNGYFELPDVLFNKRQNNQSDFRIICGARLPVRRITLSDMPFADPDFQLAVARAWQTRYTGPAKDYVDTSTLKGKVMAGYQGWFGTPNDIADNGGWRHWSRSNPITPESFTIDMWPDLTEYDPATLARAADVVTRGGEPAYLFSSRNHSAVQKHFRWMRKHNIDGAWLQRFHPKAGAESEWVLRNVSQAAAEEGRIWGVEYDVSGMADATVAAKLQADWEWLTTQFGLLDDPRYIREGGKPVVFIWGFPFASRGFTTTSANAALDYFRAQGAYVIGGIPNDWNTLSADWKTHIAKYDGVLVWQNNNTSDAAFFRNRGQDFYPHIWPGFSWANLKQLPATPLAQYTDRTGGQYYWSKARDWINAGGADRLFIGMFDEYDESTAIMPMTDDPPNPSAAYGRFIDNQGKPSDWWMMLSDEIKRMMLGQRTNTSTLPTVASLSNRSNIGPEASIDLGATDVESSLSRVPQADGSTSVETVGGKECRGNTTPATDGYMYFNVNNAFAYQLVNGDVTIEVEYYDISGSTVLGLQYDGAANSYTVHSQPITTTGGNTWRSVRFEVTDAYFGGRQNGSSDFRLSFSGKKLNVNRVWVRLPEGKTYPFSWTNATVGPALSWSQNANWLGGIVGQSDPTSIIKFFPGQTLPGGTVPIANNLTGQQFGTLQLGGTAPSSADTTVTLSGNSFSLGGTAPTIRVDATKTAFDLAYDISAPVTLLGTAQVTGQGDASLRLSGVLSGSGGLTKTHTGTLTLTGANTYLGNTKLLNGRLLLGAGNNRLPVTTSVSLGTGSNIVGFDLNGSNQELAGLAITAGATAASNSVSNSSLTPATLTVNTAASPSSFAGNLTGNLALTKTGANLLTLSNGNTYTGATRIDNGVLKSGVDNALPVGTALALGSGANVGGLNLDTFNQTVASLNANSDSVSANTLAIAAGKTLTVAGDFTVGLTPGAAQIVTNLTATGLGELKITTGNFQLGASNSATLGNPATLNLSGLARFTYDSSTGNFRVGTTGANASSGTNTATLILANTNTITAALVSTNSGAGSANAIKLGSGLNSLNATTINIGLTGGRSAGGTLDFSSPTGSLRVRGLSGLEDSPAATMTVGYGNASTTSISTGNLVDLTGHESNLLLGSLQIAGRTATGNGGPTSATFGFDTGTLTAAGVLVGDRRGNGTAGNAGLVDGTLNLGGGTVIIGSTGFSIGTNTATTSGNSVIGRLNISGGTVTVGATAGRSIQLGNNSNAANGGATAELNLTGGTLTVAGSIIKGSTTGALTSTLKLGGGTLDMGGFAIGASGAGAINLTAESGTLRNVASINGSGGLTKTTGGMLTVSGSNNYSGATTITGGTLALGAGSALPNSSAVSIGTANLNAATSGTEDAGTLAVTGTAILSLAAGAKIEFDPSNAIPWSGTLNLTGIFVPGSSLKFGNSNGLNSTQLGKISAAGVTGFTLDASGYLTATGPVFSSWITGTFANGQVPLEKRAANDDPDNDGIPNLVEYAIAGQDPTASNDSAGTFNGITLSFTKRAGTNGLTYAIQKSTDLGATAGWAAVTGVPPAYINDASTISFTLTPGTPAKNFLRLQVLSQ